MAMSTPLLARRTAPLGAGAGFEAGSHAAAAFERRAPQPDAFGATFDVGLLAPYVPSRVQQRYARRRAVALVLLVAVLLGLVVAGRAALAALAGPPASAPGARSVPAVAPASAVAPVVVVQPGDTLWSIARRLQPEGDVRALVHRLAEANGGAAIDAGDRLVVP